MPRSPLTETIKRVQGMVFYVQENLSADEYMLFLDMVDPQPDPAPTKKTRKKRTTKSARASGMAAAIKDSLEQGKAAAADTPKSNGQLCTAKIPGLGVECGDPEDNRVHDKSAGYAGYHPFVAPAPATATRRSSRKGAAANSTPNSETGSDAAMSASGD